MRLILAAALSLAAFPVLAAERCEAPQASWRPIDDLKAELTGKGWTIKNVKTEDGCYEVYGTDGDGNRVEVFFDPASFAMVGSDD